MIIRLLAVLLLIGGVATAETVTFGSGANQFSMEFVDVGNPGNAAATHITWSNSVGKVDYVYGIGKYEVSREQFEKAGFGVSLANMTAYGGNDANKPATGMNWFRAAQFVNYLNTSKGYASAYKFDLNGNFQLWTPTEAGYNASNQYRNSLARFFLPSMDEWFKAAYYSPYKAVFGGYWIYANQSDSLPNAVGGSLNGNEVVYGQPLVSGPAVINNSGGPSYYGTMAQNGNASEWLENAYDRTNNNPDDYRVMTGGSWFDGVGSINNQAINTVKPDLDPQLYGGSDLITIGFRVALIPEPSSLSLLLAGGTLLLGIRKRLKK